MKMNDEIFIPERFQRAVVLHIIKNLSPQKLTRTPLILGIHGPSGDGKTYQCEKVMEQIGAKAFLISGGQLESHEAGEPAYLVRTAYLNAGMCIQTNEAKAAVVLINDVDTGLGNWGELVQYTINRQTVFGELMHIVDYPESVEGRKTKRIPIILTGNDFTKLYEPLVRAGRMTSFEWKTTFDEKVQIVTRIFPELSLRETSDLVDEFSTQSIAFFSHLRTTLIDLELWERIRIIGLSEIVNHISRGYANDLQPPISLQSLIIAGNRLLQSGQLLNHLREH